MQEIVEELWSEDDLIVALDKADARLLLPPLELPQRPAAGSRNKLLWDSGDGWEERWLKCNYRRHGPGPCAAALGRTYAGVKTHARLLKLRRVARIDWTEARLAELKTLYPTLGRAATAKHFDVAPHVLDSVAARHELQINEHRNWTTGEKAELEKVLRALKRITGRSAGAIVGQMTKIARVVDAEDLAAVKKLRQQCSGVAGRKKTQRAKGDKNP